MGLHVLIRESEKVSVEEEAKQFLVVIGRGREKGQRACDVGLDLGMCGAFKARKSKLFSRLVAEGTLQRFGSRGTGGKHFVGKSQKASLQGNAMKEEDFPEVSRLRFLH